MPTAPVPNPAGLTRDSSKVLVAWFRGFIISPSSSKLPIAIYISSKRGLKTVFIVMIIRPPILHVAIAVLRKSTLKRRQEFTIAGEVLLAWVFIRGSITRRLLSWIIWSARTSGTFRQTLNCKSHIHLWSNPACQLLINIQRSLKGVIHAEWGQSICVRTHRWNNALAVFQCVICNTSGGVIKADSQVVVVLAYHQHNPSSQ